MAGVGGPDTNSGRNHVEVTDDSPGTTPNMPLGGWMSGTGGVCVVGCMALAGTVLVVKRGRNTGKGNGSWGRGTNGFGRSFDCDGDI
eukprot:SAG31_NODE_1788_length_7267_cov_6.640067_8_plen_87_part_00